MFVLSFAPVSSAFLMIYIIESFDFVGVFLFALFIIYVGTFGFRRLFRHRFDSSQAKRDLISSIITFVCTLPLELPKDLRFRVLLNYDILGKFQNLTLVIRIVVLILLKIKFDRAQISVL